ncbi:MAG: type II secretion system F family protein [Pseudomonadota bacterium]|nr:type II secretion system F family protein [Pseudomonadota bacterium]
MEHLLQLFSLVLGDTEHMRWAFAGAIGLATILFLLGVATVINGAIDPLRRRIRIASEHSGRAATQSSARFADALSPFASVILPRNTEELGRMRRKLAEAGYRSPNALATFYSVKFVLTIVFFAVMLMIVTKIPDLSKIQLLTFLMIGTAIGLVAPNFHLNRRQERRKKMIVNAFPDALDLLVSCTEAGLGLNAAIERVSQELSVSAPILASELYLVNAEIRAGVERGQALRNLSERNGVDDIRGLVSLINQSMRFGTSIAETLRVYAEEFRDKRMQRADEQAAKLGTKMIFPMVFCMFPSFFLIAAGPAVIGVIRALEGTPPAGG